jgi:hypothetical protein
MRRPEANTAPAAAAAATAKQQQQRLALPDIATTMPEKNLDEQGMPARESGSPFHSSMSRVSTGFVPALVAISVAHLASDAPHLVGTSRLGVYDCHCNLVMFKLASQVQVYAFLFMLRRLARFGAQTNGRHSWSAR